MNRVREFRLAKGLTLQQVADLAGIAFPQNISRIERGISGGSPETRIAIAKGLDKPVDYVFPEPVKRRGEKTGPYGAKSSRTEPCPFCGDRCRLDNKYIPPENGGRYAWYHSRECYEAEIATRQYACQ